MDSAALTPASHYLEQCFSKSLFELFHLSTFGRLIVTEVCVIFYAVVPVQWWGIRRARVGQWMWGAEGVNSWAGGPRRRCWHPSRSSGTPGATWRSSDGNYPVTHGPLMYSIIPRAIKTSVVEHVGDNKSFFFVMTFRQACFMFKVVKGIPRLFFRVWHPSSTLNHSWHLFPKPSQHEDILLVVSPVSWFQNRKRGDALKGTTPRGIWLK